MTPEQTDLWLEIQHRQMLALERIALAVETLAPATKAAPSYQHSLENFARFDWATINATVERSDQYGAAIVIWRGQQYFRRSPSNKFGEAIWFSRCTGKGEDKQNQYERLITFKPISTREIEPLPEKIARFVAGDRSQM